MSGSGYVHPVERRAKKRELLLADDEIGKITDRAMADRHGVSQSTVYKARKYAGISGTNATPRGTAEARVLAQDDLGEVPDMVIAERLGVADTTVCIYRNRAGILPFAPQFSQRLREVSDGPHALNDELLRGWGR